MKKKYTLLLSIFLSQTVPVMAMDLEGVEHHRTPHQVILQAHEVEDLVVNFALTDEANLLIRTLARNLNDEICQITREGITNHINQMIRNNGDYARTLRLNLRRFFGELNSLSDAVNTNPMILATFLEQNFLDAQVRTKIDDIIFLQNICPDVTCRTQDWRQAINGTLTPLFDYGMNPVSHFEGERLTLTGSLLGSSDIETYLNGRAATNINVQARHTFFIDQDIRMSGVNLTLNTTHLKVIGDREIDLSGSDASDFNPPRAENGIQISNNNPDEFHRRNGQDGAAGHPGGDGGNFRGVWTAPDGLENLTINTSGGQGGRGQEGGNGADGRNGDDGETAVRNRDGGALVRRERVGSAFLESCLRLFFTFNENFIETYESAGTSGEDGGQAGRGGAGGNGGQPGVLIINNNHPALDQRTFYNNPGGTDGPGADGRAGIGGRNGRFYRGVYMNEYIAPVLQGIGEVDNNAAEGVPDNIAEEIPHIEVPGAAVAALREQGDESAIAMGFAVVRNVATGVYHAIARTTRDPRVVYEAAKEALKASWRASGREGGRAAYEAAKEALKASKAVAQAGTSTVLSSVGTFGLNIAIQTAISGVVAYYCSYWIEEPHEIDSENAQPEEQPND